MKTRLLIALALTLPGCAHFDHQPLIIAAGSSFCTAPANGKCEEMQRVADSLNTGALAKAIEEARMK